MPAPKMFKKIIKQILYFVVLVFIRFGGKSVFYLSKKYAAFYTKLIHFLEWNLSDRLFNKKTSSNYKHEINLYNWIYDPNKVLFVEGASLARLYIIPNDRILDLCCGDGSYAYLFFSDISKSIDAIDYDKNILNYARKNYKKSNINFIYANLLDYEFINNRYNIVTWISGIAYFTKKERKIIFFKIKKSLKKNGLVFIRTRLEKKIEQDANQKEVILNEISFKKEFTDNYKILFEKESFYKKRIFLNYILKKK